MNRYFVVYEGTGGCHVSLTVVAASVSEAVLAALDGHAWLDSANIVGVSRQDEAINVAWAMLDKSQRAGMCMLS